MKPCSAIISLLIILLMIAIPASAATVSASTTSSSSGSASASTTISPDQALAQVYVSSVVLEPASYYPYEKGTVTVKLTNSGNQAVVLGKADLIDNKITLENPDSYNSMIYLGPGNTMTYTFQITVKPTDGIIFPLFTVSSRDSGSVRYPIRIDIDSSDIIATVSDKPDNFAKSTKAQVNLTIINPRTGDINNIIVTPEGTGFVASPVQQYVSSLAAGSSVQVPFDITPNEQSNATFHITYRNGPYNEHIKDVVLPLTIGQNKLAANPVINNIEFSNQGTSYKLTGDVNNAGITDAKALVVSVGAPAKPVDPYPSYAIGSLASDDFSSFEVTFTTNDLSSVPVVITWKDADGNSFSSTTVLDMRATSESGTGSISSSGSARTASSGSRSASGFTGGGGPPGGGGILGFGGSRGNGISAFYPVIAAGIIIAAGVVLYMKRKWIQSKLKKK